MKKSEFFQFIDAAINQANALLMKNQKIAIITGVAFATKQNREQFFKLLNQDDFENEANRYIAKRQQRLSFWRICALLFSALFAFAQTGFGQKINNNSVWLVLIYFCVCLGAYYWIAFHLLISGVVDDIKALSVEAKEKLLTLQRHKSQKKIQIKVESEIFNFSVASLVVIELSLYHSRETGFISFRTLSSREIAGRIAEKYDFTPKYSRVEQLLRGFKSNPHKFWIKKNKNIDIDTISHYLSLSGFFEAKKLFDEHYAK